MLRLLLLLISVGFVATTANAQSTQREVISPVTGSLESVCHLRATRPRVLWLGGQANSSGVIYQGRFLITAAHNVYSPSYNRLTSLKVSCGVADAAQGQHIDIDLSRIRVAPGYFWRRFGRDFAVVELPQSFTVQRPFSLDSEATDFSNLNIAGFPGTNDATDRMNGERMFTGTGTGSAVGRLLSYQILTFAGNSGGPVWNETPTGPALVGVHVLGPEGQARRVDQGFLHDLDAMIADLVATRP